MNRIWKVHRSLSYANVMATLAVFVALGSSSYAAVEITGANVRDNSLTGKDIRDNSLTGRDIRDSSLTSADIRNGSLLAKDFKKGQLPTAGGPGDATTWTFHRAFVHTDALPAIPGLAQLTAVCYPSDDGTMFLYARNTSGVEVDSMLSVDTTTAANSRLERHQIDPGSEPATRLDPGISRVIWQIAPQRDSDPGPVATVIASYSGTPGQCNLTASATYQEPSSGTPANTH